MNLKEFFETLSRSPTDVAILYLIRPFRAGQNLSPAEFVGQGVLRLRREFANSRFSYSIWFAQLRRLIKIEAGNLCQRSARDAHRFGSLSLTSAAGISFELDPPATTGTPEELLLEHEALMRLEEIAGLAETIVDEFVQKRRIPKRVQTALKKVFRAYILDPRSLNREREELAPNLPRNRVGEWWHAVRSEIVDRITRN
jgi:hypothetical protein